MCQNLILADFKAATNGSMCLLSTHAQPPAQVKARGDALWLSHGSGVKYVDLKPQPCGHNEGGRRNKTTSCL